MALIIRLNNEAPASQDTLDDVDINLRQSAEVILFPGVRYERWADTQPQDVNVQQAGQDSSEQYDERDWLDI